MSVADVRSQPSGFLDALAARSRPLILGVVNVTPDSFYAESRKAGTREALEHALRLVEEGADALDIGGQSTRPGSEAVSCDEELSRVLPVIEAVAARTRLPLSIDTDKAVVAVRARQAGAAILNDVRGLRGAGMVDAAIAFEAVIIMHMGGESPKTMQERPRYGDVVEEVRRFFHERKAEFLRAGGKAAGLLYDPGIGFGKTLEHNLSLIKRLDALAKDGPLVLGVSRKSFLGRISADSGPEERLEGSLAAACWGALHGAAVVRVHDVKATRKALDTLAAIGKAR